jgi:hypothetical protein
MSNRPTAPQRPRWSDPRPLVFHVQRLHAQTGRCVHFGHPAAPRCTSQAIPGTRHCTDHTEEI